MAEGGVQRRLAAIVIADLVGYSRHMERDPTGTRERFQSIQKELVEPILAEHQGRIVNVMGDAFLIEFGSAVVAVKAVVEFQRRLAEQEAARKHDEQITTEDPNISCQITKKYLVTKSINQVGGERGASTKGRERHCDP